MNKKILLVLFVVVLFVSCTKRTNDSYLKWNPIVVSGDAKIQESKIDSICMAVAAERNLTLEGERCLRMKDKPYKQGTIEMESFEFDVMYMIEKLDEFERVPSGKKDSIGYTMELRFSCIQEVTKNGQTMEGQPQITSIYYLKYKK